MPKQQRGAVVGRADISWDDWWVLRKRLSGLIRKWNVPRDFHDDLITETLLSLTDKGIWTFDYASVALRNAVLCWKRDRTRRNEWQNIDLTNNDEVFDKKQTTFASQEVSRELNEVLLCISRLRRPTKDVIILAAIGCDATEISRILMMEKKETYWRLQLARKTIRSMGFGEEGKRGHPKFHGIRKDCQKWSAAIRKGGEYYYLGYHDTAAAAARAYDEKAKTLFGENAKLNFAGLAS